MGDLLQRAKWEAETKSLLAVGWRQSRYQVTGGDIPAARESVLGLLLDMLLSDGENVKLLPSAFPQG